MYIRTLDEKSHLCFLVCMCSWLVMAPFKAKTSYFSNDARYNSQSSMMTCHCTTIVCDKTDWLE